MMDKPKVAICWLGSCGGCDEAIVDLNEAILQVADAVEIIFWPIAMDFKYQDIEAMDDGEITLSIISGNIRNSEQEEMAELFRKKSKIVLALGTCACLGGSPGLANFRTKEDIINWVYRDAPTVVNPKENCPQQVTQMDGKELTLPEFYSEVFALNQIINVDYYIPGCPPTSDLIMNAINLVLKGDLPPKGSTLVPNKPLCETCPRNETKPDRLALKEIKRIHEVDVNPYTCFLAQGLLCLGPVTRTGCKEACININVPCRGCFGPVDGVTDGGSKFISSLAAILDADSELEAQKVVDTIKDLPGYLYRFSLPTSLLQKRRS